MVFFNYTQTSAWCDTPAGRVDTYATMALMQMVADAYSSAQVAWEEENRLRKGKGKDREADSVQDSGPNEAQKRVLQWLVHANYLPPSSLPLPSVEENGCKHTAVKSLSSSSSIRQNRTTSLPSLSPKKIWTSMHERRKSLPSLIVSPPTPTESQPAPFPERKKTHHRHSWHSHLNSPFHEGPHLFEPTAMKSSNQHAESTVDELGPAAHQSIIPHAEPPCRLGSTMGAESSNPTCIIDEPETSLVVLPVPRPPILTPTPARRATAVPQPPVSIPRTSTPKAPTSPPLLFNEKQRLPPPAAESDEERPVTLWTLFAITSLGYVVIFILLTVFFLFGLCNLLRSCVGREDHD